MPLASASLLPTNVEQAHRQVQLWNINFVEACPSHNVDINLQSGHNNIGPVFTKFINVVSGRSKKHCLVLCNNLAIIQEASGFAVFTLTKRKYFIDISTGTNGINCLWPFVFVFYIIFHFVPGIFGYFIFKQPDSSNIKRIL